MIEKGCSSCAKTRGVNCNYKKTQHEYCRDYQAKKIDSSKETGVN